MRSTLIRDFALKRICKYLSRVGDVTNYSWWGYSMDVDQFGYSYGIMKFYGTNYYEHMGFYLGYGYNMALLVNEKSGIADFWGQHPESHRLDFFFPSRQMASWLLLKWLRYPEPTDSKSLQDINFGETTNHIFARKIKAMLLWSTSSFHSAGFDFLLVEEQTPYDHLQTARPPGLQGRRCQGRQGWPWIRSDDLAVALG